MIVRHSNLFMLAVCFLLIASSTCEAQRGQGQRKGLDVPDHPQAVGEAGVAWYTTWKSGLAEAKRSNRPIFFMSAATTCSGISGVF